ncbi:ABC transporter substrate-binding protein [Saliphagus infecundisoli]|uniref:ABC transporter substrate-binding protein n=1 Tax=Saliphagus infecundisoli TaxID=1849069 RepID=A0ABD5Q9Z0_9EURY|nr:ABC transporter substrate-binding protein [Saliphagus infecundisoli]
MTGPSTDRLDRRSLLAALGAGGLGATAGCVHRARNAVNRDGPEQLSLTITTVPADVDQVSIRIANDLQANLAAVGIEASIDPLSVEEFFRATLVNHDFDLFVGHHPGDDDPDFLYESLHSVFASEPGWQNPYGFTNMAFDTLLERQRRIGGEARRTTIGEILEALAAEQPFVPLCVPTEHRLLRTDRFEGWNDDLLASRLGYLGLEQVEGAEGPNDRLRALVTDARSTVNLNPLSAEYYDQSTYIDLLYDSLATADGDGFRPWLAESWEWEGRTVTVRLRPDLSFHDGESLTADDVAFTYRFLDDTTLGDEESIEAPAPRYQGQVTAVEEVIATDDRTVEIEVSTGREVGERALAVPILPEHVWRERAEEVEIAGISISQGTTEAVVTDNIPPVGSGPFAFVERTERESLELARFEDHFSLREDAGASGGDVEGEGDDDGENGNETPPTGAERRESGPTPAPTVAELGTRVEPSSPSTIESMGNGDGDVTVTPIEPHTIGDVEEREGLALRDTSSRAFYQVGFNVRNAPFGNPYFRRTVARLLDKAWIARDVFYGHADPVATPLPEGWEQHDGDDRNEEASDEWVPESLRWDGEDPEVPFFGEDGDLDAEAARAEFEEIGFQYNDQGDLLMGE